MFKTIKPVLVAGSLCLAIVLCKKDIVEQNPVSTEKNITATADATGNSSYYPVGSGTNQNYLDTTAAGPSTSAKATIENLGDTTIDEKTFSKTSATGSSAVNYVNSTNGVTTLVSFNGKDKITSTVLKANEPVGTVWTDEFTNAGVPSVYEWKLAAKGLTKTVLGVTYANVIQVHLNGTAKIPSKGNVAFADADYFYTPNVGLIEHINYNTVTGKPELHRVLQNPVKL